jgi:diguanylate cyclase (GGDEF)-like protein
VFSTASVTKEQLHAMWQACTEVANFPDADQASRGLTERLSEILSAPTLLYHREVSPWKLLASSHGGADSLPCSAAPGAELDQLFATSDILYRPITTAGNWKWTPIPIDQEVPCQSLLLLPGDWSEHRLDWLPRFAQTASMAIRLVSNRSKARVADELGATTYTFARKLAQASGDQVLSQHIVDTAAKVANARFASLFVFQQKEAALTVAATHGYPREDVQHVQISPTGGIVGGVFSSKRPLLVRDTTRVPGLRPVSTRYQTASFMAIPIVGKDDALGVITLADRGDGQPFSRRDLAATRVISAVARLALERQQLTKLADELAQTAATDPLTGMFNRRYFHTRLHSELERSRRDIGPVAVMMLDVDTFKSVNDRMGHHAGDAVLRKVAEIIKGSVRTSDVCARYGGDEFAILANESTDSATHTGERIRHRVDAFPWEALGFQEVQRVTVSIGIAIAEATDTPETLVQRADHNLYEAKSRGRNRVHPRRTDLATGQGSRSRI